jgi:hypothetical protein
MDNLQSTGWSPVKLNVRALSTPSASACILQTHETWKDQLMELFEPDVVAAAQKRESVASHSPSIVYRAAESGAPGTVEPKQSWQVLRCSCIDCCKGKGVPPQEEEAESESSITVVRSRMKEWVSVLHSVAVTVRRILQFPEGILLHEESCHSDSNYDSNNGTIPCSTDLLRAFFYDTVAISDSDDTTASPAPCMGSSPHTDWGSFTVVWQDTVGGLQTYCHCCEKWVDVAADTDTDTDTPGSDSDSSVVQFVVHVGDVTSLALGHALLQTSQNSSNEHERSEVAVSDNDNVETNTASTTSVVVWPSPRHRVLSPTTQKRASLVYFAYPPVDKSIREITLHLTSWCRRVRQQQDESLSMSLGPKFNHVPYEDYYLLRNQQSIVSSVTPEQQFKAIVDRPLKDVLAEKWEQVQRN